MVEPLTTIEQPKYEMGRLANLLIESLSNKKNKNLEISLKPTLIRKSTHEL